MKNARTPRAPIARTLIALAVGLLLAGTPVASRAAGSDPQGRAEPQLPDLRTLQPNGLRLVHDTRSGRTFLRFNNSIINLGPGPLELFGRDAEIVDHRDYPIEGHEAGPHQHVSIYQRITDADGNVLIEPFVGELIHHNQHAHWHLESFSTYEVWAISPQGVTYNLVGANSKVSYCVTDLRPAGPELGFETRPKAGYLSCSGMLQGLTQGWIDTYVSGLARQWVEISGVKDGNYVLRSIVDPEDRIRETDDSNNAAITHFQIVDGQLHWETVRDVLQDVEAVSVDPLEEVQSMIFPHLRRK